jgi:hypothetical protein
MSNCLFEFIPVEGGVKSMKIFKGGASYKILGTPEFVYEEPLYNRYPDKDLNPGPPNTNQEL